MSAENNPLFVPARKAIVAITTYMILADHANLWGLVPRKENGWLGGITDHVGDAIVGLYALFSGPMVSQYLEARGMDHEKARLIGLAVIAGAFTFAIWAEMTGFMNSTDLLDLPGLGIGLIGGASLLELIDENRKKTLQK